MVQRQAAAAFNPSLPGAKIEDTVLVRDSGLDALRSIHADPRAARGRQRPELLVRSRASARHETLPASVFDLSAHREAYRDARRFHARTRRSHGALQRGADGMLRQGLPTRRLRRAATPIRPAKLRAWAEMFAPLFAEHLELEGHLKNRGERPARRSMRLDPRTVSGMMDEV